MEGNAYDDLSRWLQMLYAIELVYTPALAITKLSILLLYARIFPGLRFRKYLYGTGALISLWLIACQFAAIFECTPIYYFWTRNVPTAGHCINLRAYFFGQAAPNIITDILLMALPLPQIWKLQLPQKSRIGLSGIFVLGCLSV